MNPFPKNPADLEQQAQQEQELLEFLKSNPEIMKKYQEEVTKMQGKGSKVQQLPMSSEEYNSKVKSGEIEGCLDEEGGLVIQPDKGLVLKYIDRHSGQKIFVNVVKHPGVDHPEEKELVDLENQAGLRIPMSMGRVREDSDKKGVPCKVVDVVMNSQIVETAEKNNDIFYFMAQIIGNYLLEKHKIATEDEKITKVNMKYKGNNVQIQRIRAKKSPKVEEMPQQKSEEQEQSQQKLLNDLSGHTGKKQQTPEFRIYGVDYEGELEEYSLENKGKIKEFILEFDLSLLIHSRGIHLEASDKVLYFFVRGLYEICLRLPEPMDGFKATFGKKQRQLRVTGKVKSTEEVKTEVVPSKKVEISIESDQLDELV